MHNLFMLTKTDHQTDFILILVLNTHLNNNYETNLSKKYNSVSTVILKYLPLPF